ncbi:murein biosynthesis integral membrane protein MurJ [Evansella tamaricis]|uniref:Probable lipid II flippase MurJ n=1 Tax=Evansella tamaricis TaxID=2069301 RepID=A0ABS6JG23_9BACI|nr:murein biosynthesis integral membrane protein MurJ [Evansella tamaricis]MBU9712164.1 murein biosynthesis integral membrane protein MurJ [Evansella tamaricis]
MKKTVIIIMVLTVGSKFLGFFRDIILSYFYGASNITDVYLIALTIPSVIFAIIGEGISTGYIPMYTRIENNYGTERANKFTNNLINVLMLFCTIILIIGLLFTEQIVRLFASGFEGDTLLLAVSFTRISIVGVYFTGLIYVFSSFLQLKGNFVIPGIIGLPFNTIIIIFIVISANSNIYVLIFGSVLAIVSQALLLSVYSYKYKYKYYPKLDYKDSSIKRMFLLATPAIVGSSVIQLNLLIDRTLASNIAEGGISALNYAHNLNLFILGIVVASITTVLFPTITKMAEKNNMEELKKSLASAITGINLLVLPATVGYMIFSEQIVQVLFGRGEFDSNAVSMTSSALFYYSIGISSIGLRMVLTRVYYALHDSKTPMVNSSISMIVNIILNIVLSRYLGIAGLALATSLAAIFSTLLLFRNLHTKIQGFGIRDLFYSLIKMLVASLLMGVLSKITFTYLFTKMNLTVSFFLAVFTGVVIYFVFIFIFRIRELDIVINQIKRRITNRTEEKNVS